ncbi:serine/threonine-protein kinase RsbW [Glaciihabitans tibetensis]|uniref:Serine/threonine-protein kinase RsbW n=1 Tax=Glaciihabitans tibetensis TaxID=1266600 RepID=A0A2T0V6U3_9MICO|nr:ATP-binding protein [Glaciihabitans tibetensis]PRY65893.1 serine/threonine-protein kinase RsbW [Glaciihabitans tibetensis]
MSERTIVFHTPPDEVDVVHVALASLWAQDADVDAMDRMMFETALIELVSNVIEHGDSQTTINCTLDLAVDESTMKAVLVDTASPPRIDLSPREMPDEFAESGRGLAFIQALVDDFDYRRAGGSNIWTLNKRRALLSL